MGTAKNYGDSQKTFTLHYIVLKYTMNHDCHLLLSVIITSSASSESQDCTVVPKVRALGQRQLGTCQICNSDLSDRSSVVQRHCRSSWENGTKRSLFWYAHFLKTHFFCMNSLKIPHIYMELNASMLQNELTFSFHLP